MKDHPALAGDTAHRFACVRFVPISRTFDYGIRLPFLLVLIHAVPTRADRHDEQQPPDDGHRLEKVVF